MSECIEVGDIVTLASGGIGMTVVLVNEDGKVACHWSGEDAKGKPEVKMQSYPSECLVVAIKRRKL